jgi:5-methylcytosine-specific restriction endonuclease McrA
MRDGGVCQLQTSPRCKGVANSVDHVIPVALGGDFWSPANLRASCSSCNSRGGSHTAAEVHRRTVTNLHEIIQQQDEQIQRLIERVQELERSDTQPRRMPAVY